MSEVTAVQVLLAFALDMLIGDPRWLPHPVRLIGTAISAMEQMLRRFFLSPSGERFAGVLLVISIVAPAYFLSGFVAALMNDSTGRIAAIFGGAVFIYLIATTIASRELMSSAKLVITAIKGNDLESGRRHVSMIVGRDTKELSHHGVLKAAIETLAENLSDGVVAPLLYLAIGGLPLAMAYKGINTLDSMVGYNNDRYRNFGWAAAKLDDAANFIPARLSGLIIVVSVYLLTLVRDAGKALAAARRAYSVMVRDGRKHPSPNSGVPEAAMAGALSIRLGGPSTYGGVLSNKPFIGDEGEVDFVAASQTALTLTAIASCVAAGIASVITALRSML